MDIKKANQFLEKKIEELETAIYQFDTIMKPRVETDKIILERLRDQYGKMQVLMEKVKRGEPIKVEEYEEAVPKELR